MSLNKFYLIGLLLLVLGNMQGQSRYPYTYSIEPYQKKIPSSYTITYEDKDSYPNGKPDSIWLVVKDTFALSQDSINTEAVSLVYYSKRDTFVGSVFFKDSVKLEYSSDLIRIRSWDFSIYDIYIKDTGTTKVISKVIVIKGIIYDNHLIAASKIPLRKKTINAIREYLYKKGPKPWVLKKKICEIKIVL